MSDNCETSAAENSRCELCGQPAPNVDLRLDARGNGSALQALICSDCALDLELRMDEDTVGDDSCGDRVRSEAEKRDTCDNGHCNGGPSLAASENLELACGSCGRVVPVTANEYPDVKGNNCPECDDGVLYDAPEPVAVGDASEKSLEPAALIHDDRELVELYSGSWPNELAIHRGWNPLVRLSDVQERVEDLWQNEESLHRAFIKLRKELNAEEFTQKDSKNTTGDTN